MDDVSEEAVSNLIRLALACEASKRALRREDIVKIVLDDSGARNFRALLDSANERLQRDFAMELVSLPTAPRPTSTQTVAGRRAATVAAKRAEQQQQVSSAYILVSTEARPVGKFHPQPEQLGLLVVILSLITLSPGGVLEEPDLLERLEKLGISDQTYALNEHIAELRRQRYLAVSKSDQKVDLFQVGPRGHVEFPPAALAKFICELGEYRGDMENLALRVNAAIQINRQ